MSKEWRIGVMIQGCVHEMPREEAIRLAHAIRAIVNKTYMEEARMELETIIVGVRDENT